MRQNAMSRAARRALLLLAVAGCSDPVQPIPHNPVSGTYDLQTNLTTYTWETTNSIGQPVLHTQSFSGASLGGAVTVSDSGNAAGFYMSGVFSGALCSQSDDVQGCTAVAPHGPSTLSSFSPAGTTPTDTTNASLTYGYADMAAPGLSGETVGLSAYHVTGDSIYGAVTWMLAPGHTPKHLGTFVAHRRR